MSEMSISEYEANCAEGATTAFKDGLQRLYRESKINWRAPVGFAGPLTLEGEDNRAIPAFRLSAFKPRSRAAKWLRENNIDTVERLLSVNEDSLPPTIQSDVKHLKCLHSSREMWNVCASAESARSLLEYIFGVWKAFKDEAPEKLYIIATCMGLGNKDKAITQESVAEALGMTGDKKRAAVWEMENKIRGKVFSPAYRREVFADVYTLVDGLISADGVVEGKKLVANIEGRFGWGGTTCWSAYCLLKELGYDVERTENSMNNTITFRFKGKIDSRREDAFQGAVCEITDAESASFENIRLHFIKEGLGELSIDEYKSYCDSILAKGGLPSITRGYLRHARNGHASSVVDNRVIMRKVFSEAFKEGKKFLLKEDVVNRCKKLDAKTDWEKAFKSLMQNDGRLDDNDSFVFQYCYFGNGGVGKPRTGYALSDNILDDNLRSSLREMVTELSKILAVSGHKVLGIHKVMGKIESLCGLDPLGVFFLARGLREFKGQLLFHATKDMRFCVSLPNEVDKTGAGNLLAQEAMEYFSAQGKEYVSTSELKDFLDSELQLEFGLQKIPWLKWDDVRKKYKVALQSK